MGWGGLVGFEGGHEQKYGLNVKTFVLGPPLFDKKQNTSSCDKHIQLTLFYKLDVSYILNIRFQKYRYNFENCTYILIDLHGFKGVGKKILSVKGR